MKAIIYTRVSQDRSGELKSVSSQEDECRALCKRNGWEVVGVYTDNDRSASRYAKKQRPEFQRLMGDLSTCDVLVTWEASRATRDLEVYTALRTACRVSGVKWAYSGRVYDLARTDDAFSTGLDMLVAERESGATSERIQRSTRAQAAAGKPHGRVPFGYVREYDQSSGALVRQVPHPDESKIIQEAAERVLAGDSAYAIAKDLRASDRVRMGGKPWEPQRLTRLLRNPTYAGKRVYRGTVIGEADWPALIAPDQWQALQAILSSPTRTKFHGSEPQWLLTGIATCGVCGATVNRLLNRGRNAYLCRAKSCVSRSVEDVDAVVNAVVKNILMSDDAMAAIHSHADPAVSNVANEIHELEMRLEGFYGQAAKGALSPAGLVRVEGQVLQQLKAARALLSAQSTPSAVTIANPKETAGRWDSMPLLERREIVRGLMTVTILPAIRGARTFDPTRIEIRQRL